MYIKKDLFGYEIVMYNDNTNRYQHTDYNNYERNYITESKFRAKRQVIEYTMNNVFNWFVTITFDKNKIDRYDVKLLESKVLQWLNNTRLNYGNKAKYILVPEYHKDGAIHYHALISLENDKLRYLYNHQQWKKPVYKDRLLFNKFGRNQWVSIDQYTEPVGLYLSKYITKLPDKMNNRYYFVSKGLNISEKLPYDEAILEKIIDKTPTASTHFCTIYRLSYDEMEKIIK
jgi:hypothetical protein